VSPPVGSAENFTAKRSYTLLRRVFCGREPRLDQLDHVVSLEVGEPGAQRLLALGDTRLRVRPDTG
jgi:hypothetical protein